jgi:hypothetical protein
MHLRCPRDVPPTAYARPHAGVSPKLACWRARELPRVSPAANRCMGWSWLRAASTLRVASLPREVILSTGTVVPPGHFGKIVPTIAMRPEEESRFGDWRTPKGLPSGSAPQNGKQIGRQGESLLACMTASREPSNQSFEVDREAAVCSANRRFLLFAPILVGAPQHIDAGSPSPGNPSP